MLDGFIIQGAPNGGGGLNFRFNGGFVRLFDLVSFDEIFMNSEELERKSFNLAGNFFLSFFCFHVTNNLTVLD